MDRWEPRRKTLRKIRGLAPVLALAALAAPCAAQLTTNGWLLTGAGNWTNVVNWSPGVPDSNTDVAQITNNYGGNFTITLDTDLTINGIIYQDTGGGTDSSGTVGGAGTLTFDGSNPFLYVPASDGISGGNGFTLDKASVGAGGLTVWTPGGNNNGFPRIRSLSGGGALLVTNGSRLNLEGDNPGFTGAITVEDGAILSGANLSSTRTNIFGTTNSAVTLNGSGQLRLRGGSEYNVVKDVILNGVYNRGSIAAIAPDTTNASAVLDGTIVLNTDGIVSVTAFTTNQMRQFTVNSVISDDGNDRGLSLLVDLLTTGGSSATGSLSRASKIIVGGANTYGGYTHISVNRNTDATGPYIGTVLLTNGNDRLPVGTTLFLGGATNGIEGNGTGSGRLLLNGYNQELAGLTTLGTGPSNRVAGGNATLSTLSLNIGAGITNRFTGYLGGPGTDENNMALVSKGPGVLDLTGANTYTGTTTVTNGTLRVNGSHIGGGAYAIQDGGTLGGTGLIDAAIRVLAGGAIAPGNSIGTLTVNGNFGLDGILQIELENGAGPGPGLSDLLDANGLFDITNGTLQFIYTGVLTNDAYIFAEYDVLSGNPFLSVLNMPDGYGIDYNYLGGNQIALVIPEPPAFGLFALGALTLVVFRRRRGKIAR